jgi:hypothetical protein
MAGVGGECVSRFTFSGRLGYQFENHAAVRKDRKTFR